VIRNLPNKTIVSYGTYIVLFASYFVFSFHNYFLYMFNMQSVFFTNVMADLESSCDGLLNTIYDV
jgi:hypothetical protein